MGRTMYFEDVTGKLTATVFRDAHPPPASTSSTSASRQNDDGRSSLHHLDILSRSAPLTSAHHPAPASTSTSNSIPSAASSASTPGLGLRSASEPGAPVQVKPILAHLSEKKSVLELKRAGASLIVLDFSANWDGLGDVTLGADAKPIRMDDYLRPSSCSSSSSSAPSSSRVQHERGDVDRMEEEEEEEEEDAADCRAQEQVSVSPSYHSALSGVQRTNPRSRKRSEHDMLDRRTPPLSSSWSACSHASHHHHHHHRHEGYHPYASPPPSPPRSPARHLQNHHHHHHHHHHQSHHRRPSSSCSRRTTYYEDEDEHSRGGEEGAVSLEPYEMTSNKRRHVYPDRNGGSEEGGQGTSSSRTFRASMSDGQEYTWIRTFNQTPGTATRNSTAASALTSYHWGSDELSAQAPEDAENTVLSFNCYHAATGTLIASYHPLPQGSGGSDDAERPPAVLELSSESDPLLPELVASLTIMRYIARYPDVLVNGQRTSSASASEQRSLHAYAKERERERKIRCAPNGRPYAPVRSLSASPSSIPMNSKKGYGQSHSPASSPASPPREGHVSGSRLAGLGSGLGPGLGLMTSASTPSLLRLEIVSNSHPPPASPPHVCSSSTPSTPPLVAHGHPLSPVSAQISS